MGSLVLRFCPSPDGQSRLSYVLRKKLLKKAVDRNRVRRQIREAFRLVYSEFKQPLWLVFDYQPSVKNCVDDGLFDLTSDLLTQSQIKAHKKWGSKEL